MLRYGCDRLLENAESLRGRRYAILAHGASVTSNLQPLHLALSKSEAGRPAALFGPEHGYYAVEQDMVASADATDPWTGAPLLSLYGDSESSLKPDPSAMAGLDVLLIDLQDVGSRYYTYAATAIWAAEAALAAGVEVWVLDRPNPLGGEIVEGNLLDPAYESFVGAFCLPVRHGLTLAELVSLEARRRDWDQEGLRLWTMEGWRRAMCWPSVGRPWIAPSPNMPTYDTAVVYPGGCLLEATALSEGRGTTRPFLLFGAPWVDPPALADALTELEIPGASYLPTYFKPQFQKHGGEVCGGVEVVVTDDAVFPAYRWGIEALVVLARLGSEHFAWRREPYEFVSDREAIDLLTGSPELRLSLERGECPDAWLASWAEDEDAFRAERQAVLLYA